MASVVEQRFATSFLYGLGLKKIKYPSTYEPLSRESISPLPKASRPFTPAEDEPGSSVSKVAFKLKFKVLKTSTTFDLSVTPMDLIDAIKIKAAAELKIPVNEIRLVCGGKGLSEGKTVSDYGLTEAQTIHVMRKAAVTEPENQSKESKEMLELEAVATSLEFKKSLTDFVKKHFKEAENIKLVRDGMVTGLISSVPNQETKQKISKLLQ